MSRTEIDAADIDPKIERRSRAWAIFLATILAISCWGGRGPASTRLVSETCEPSSTAATRQVFVADLTTGGSPSSW